MSVSELLWFGFNVFESLFKDNSLLIVLFHDCKELLQRYLYRQFYFSWFSRIIQSNMVRKLINYVAQPWIVLTLDLGLIISFVICDDAINSVWQCKFYCFSLLLLFLFAQLRKYVVKRWQFNIGFNDDIIDCFDIGLIACD